MGHHVSENSESRFAKYVEGLTSVIGHADRAGPLRDYCVGLWAAEGRKSVEPMAAVTAPAEVSAQHQKLLHFVANAPWSDERVLAKVRAIVVPAIERHGPIECWILDDTSYPKHGLHSVGVHHQYCGQLGKQANCQVVVTLSIANHHASLPIAYRLYLPEPWAKDAARRKKAHIPEDIAFKTKPQIAVDQMRAAYAAKVPRGVVLLDASYGSHIVLRRSVSALALKYVAAIVPTLKVRPASDVAGCVAHQCQKIGTRSTKACVAHDQMARRKQRGVSLTLCSRASARLADPRPARTTGRDTAD